MTATYDAIVIGAGHNGLIAAGYLARARRRTLVIERWGQVGGACVTEEVWPGYRISTAAYLCSLLRPEIVRDLELERHGFEVYRRETSGFAPFPDGRSLFLYPDAARTRESLAAFCRATPEDIEAFFAFELEVEQVAGIVEPFLLREPPSESELEQAFHRADAGRLYTDYIQGSVQRLLDARFCDEGLKAVLATDGLIGTFGGPSTPGTAYVLLHHYLGRILGTRGAWGYVRGGMGNITQALASSFRAYGGEIRTGTPVARILPECDQGLLRVVLASGEEISARCVLSGADPYRTFHELLGEPVEGTVWERLVTQGGASAKINLAVSELPRFSCLPRSDHAPGPEHLGTVHICPSLDYLERAWQDARSGYPSREPMIEIYLQTATDSTLTPEGRHILSLFVQYFPYHLAPGLDLNVERERFADRVIEIIGRYAPNVPGSILHWQVLTPRDLEARFGLTGGHIFHGDLLPPNLWQGRSAPHARGTHTHVPGLFLCGSGAHPGGCVFGAPGYNAAHSALRYLEKHAGA